MEIRSVAVEVGDTLYVRRGRALEEGEWYLQNGDEPASQEGDRRVVPRLEKTLEERWTLFLEQVQYRN